MIGERIRKYRKLKGFSQSDLAKLLNTSKQTISKWENNQTSPVKIPIDLLANVLGISVYDLYKEKENEEIKKLENELFELLRENRDLKKENEELRRKLGF